MKEVCLDWIESMWLFAWVLLKATWSASKQEACFLISCNPATFQDSLSCLIASDIYWNSFTIQFCTVYSTAHCIAKRLKAVCPIPVSVLLHCKLMRGSVGLKVAPLHKGVNFVSACQLWNGVLTQHHNLLAPVFFRVNDFLNATVQPHC